MDLNDLKENMERIIRESSRELSKENARHIRYEINWILSKADNNTWTSLEDACEERISAKNYSDSTKTGKKNIFRYIRRKLYPGSVPERKIYCHYEDPGDMLRVSKGYEELNQGYRDLLDAYVSLAKKAGKKRDTIFLHCSLTAGFLRHLQGMGCDHLEEAAADALMSFFYSDSLYERQIRSYSYKEKLAVVFKSCGVIDDYSLGCRHILNLIPNFRYVRKNVDYLTSSEAEAIRNSIDSGRFSAMGRAVMMLLLYTGLRACDVAAIKTSDINWKNETINIVQQKTSEPLTIAMLPAVGNAIFEYMKDKAFLKHSVYLFYGDGAGGKSISARTVGRIARKAYRLAGVRQNEGERKGTHLFRHYTATKLLENGVQHSVISRALGHTNPDSLGIYLHTDFKHLSECALSLEAYPVQTEVWNI